MAKLAKSAPKISGYFILYKLNSDLAHFGKDYTPDISHKIFTLFHHNRTLSLKFFSCFTNIFQNKTKVL